MAKTATKKPAISLGSIATIVTAPSSARKGNPDVVMDGIADLTAIDRVIAELNAARAIVDGQIREAAIKLFLDKGCAAKQRPGNFRGCELEVVDGVTLTHSVSVELRASGAGLSPEAQTLAAEHNIPVEEKVATHETYIVNPAYAEDLTLMQHVLDALNASKVAFPADLLLKQEGSKKVVTNEATVPALFRLERDTVELLLPLFTSLSVGKGKHGSLPGSDDLASPLARAARLLNRPSFRAELQGASKRAGKAA